MASAPDQEFLRAAIRLSRESAEGSQGGPFGAVVVVDGRIVGRGQNRVTSAHDPTAHAEVEAIRDACASLATFQLRGATLYSSCEPCPMCLAAIYWARVDRLVFAADRTDAAEAGFDDAALYEEIPREPHERTLPATQLLRSEALEAFRAWKQNDEKIEY